MADLSSDKKLVWLGLRNPQQDESEVAFEVGKMQELFDDFDSFKSGLDDVSSYSEFSTYLQDNGFTQEQAEAFVEKVKNNFDSWSDFKNFIQNQAASFTDITAEFGSMPGFGSGQRTADGEPVAGITLHEQAGVSQSGVSVPAGTIEVYGTRVEFSGTGSPSSNSPTISYSNLQVSNTTPARDQVFTVSADVENTGSAAAPAFPQLKFDGQVVGEKGPYQLSPSESTTVEFQGSFDGLESVQVTIGDLSPITVEVHPRTL